MQPLSIIVCSWNNKSQTELLLHSIRQNSAEEHEICLHINEASDEFIEWAKSTNRFNLSYSKENLGLAAGANTAAKNATYNSLYLVDDDMYVLPGWDKELSYVMEWYPEQS